MTIGAFIVIIIIGEVVIYLGLSSGRNPPEYFGTAIAFLFGLPFFAYFIIRSARGGKEKLSMFVWSTADVMKSWACVGPLMETGGYEADCELLNGCYVQCVFGAMSNQGAKGGILRVFRFIREPETVESAPLIKVKNDGSMLKTTRLPRKEKTFDLWQTSETPWKRRVSSDESIRTWVADQSGWRKANLAHYLPSNASSVVMLCQDIYLRSPAHEGKWLKAKALCGALNFIEPADQQEAKDFYRLTIATADKIIQHIIDAICAHGCLS